MGVRAREGREHGDARNQALLVLLLMEELDERL